MQKAPRSRTALPCILGQHRHGPVAQVDRNLYAECYRCGSDLIRKGRRWRRAGPDELPAGWKAQSPPALALPLSLIIILLTIAVIGVALYLGVR